MLSRHLRKNIYQEEEADEPGPVRLIGADTNIFITVSFLQQFQNLPKVNLKGTSNLYYSCELIFG